MSFWDLVGTGAGLAGGYALAESIGRTGDNATATMSTLGDKLQSETTFKGYGVTSGLGSSSVGADGTTTLGVGPNAALAGGVNDYAAGTGAMTDAQNMLRVGGHNPYADAGYANMNQAAAGASANATNPYASTAMNAMTGAQSGLMNQQTGAFGAADRLRAQALQDRAGREQEIYNRSMAMQQAGLDANRAQTNAQEYAAGRGGVMGSQFGGSGEDAAMARAQAQAQNQASFAAMNQASQEQMQQAQMANMFGSQGMQAAGLGNQIGLGMNQAGVANAQLGQAAAGLQNQIGMGMNQAGYQNAMLGQSAAGQLGSLGAQQAGLGLNSYQMSFLPMEQQMALMGMAQNNANLAQTGQLSGAGYQAQLGLGGIQAQINAQKAASELYGNLFGGIMNNSAQIGESLGDGWDWLKEQF